ncbi:expansin family protein [Fistulina hepatica ATCC 64428]|uniref:Expansin family protein n=1 Tax=Fistulina hepatica ATCC 64428 TaxID=1128425 RepID=A0A0D7AAP2_9AGAR|nr:expansin family protein [Fistulina hepatica ATCC 64428]
MKPFTFLSLVVAVVASGNGMTPVMRHSQRHHDLAARVAEPEPVITPLAPNVTRMHRKRSISFISPSDGVLTRLLFTVGLGACGLTSESTQMVAAVSESYFDAFDGFTGSNPNDNPICGQMATAVYGTATVTVTIVDRCAGCETDYDLDFSESAFELLTDLSVGRIDIDWWIEGV